MTKQITFLKLEVETVDKQNFNAKFKVNAQDVDGFGKEIGHQFTLDSGKTCVQLFADIDASAKAELGI